MTPSEGNPGNSGPDDTRVKKLISEGVEGTAFKAASRIAIIIVVPLLGYLVTNVIGDFKRELRKIREVQAEQTQLINQKLDQAANKLQSIVDDTKERDHELELQLRTIEEILRNTQKEDERILDELQDSPLRKDLGLGRKDGISYPRRNVHTGP